MVAVPDELASKCQLLPRATSPVKPSRLSPLIWNSWLVATWPVVRFDTFSVRRMFSIASVSSLFVTVRVPRKAWRVIVIVCLISSFTVAQTLAEFSNCCSYAV